MKVLYTAPNRSHHYRYAEMLYSAGVLRYFVSGFPRISKRAALPFLGSHLYRADIFQTFFLAASRFKINWLSAELAYWAKIEQDNSCRKLLSPGDTFLFYNGSGLNSCRYGKKIGVTSVVEAVNSHVLYQENILRDEYQQLKLAWTPFHQREVKRRIAEYEEADYILMPSEFVKNSFIELGFPASKLLKVPYGFNQMGGENILKDKKSQHFRVLYVGSISVRKGLRYLIEAFNKFQHPRKELIIVGPMNKPSGLEGMKYGSNVVFRGVLKGEALEQAYQDADVFCLPSLEEGLALVLGEALSFGLPIITTTNSGASDIITDGKEGYILPIQDSDAIANQLQQLTDNPILFQEMKEMAKEKAQKLNGWDKTGQNLVNTLKQISNKMS